VLVTVAEGALPVAVDAEVDVEVEEFGVWVVSDDVVAGGDVAVSGTAEVELELEVDVDDGEVVDVDVEDVVKEVVDVDVEDVVEDVVDEDVEVEDEGVEIATNVEDVAVVGLDEDEVDTELDGVGAEVAVDEVETADTLDDVVTAKPHPLAGAGILSSSCPECPCLVESSSTSMSTNLLSPAE
jgi:hypothetical protein